MKDNIELSVIIPAYNAEKYIYDCIKSIENQTVENIEIIIVNDGSTDNTLKIVEELAQLNEHIKIINLKKNSGVCNARVVGYLNSSGKYIGWVDSDDFIDTNMFEILLSTAKEGDFDCVYCDYRFFPKRTTFKNKWFKIYTGVIDWQFIDNNCQHWNKLIKKEVLDAVNFEYIESYVGEGAYEFVIAKCKKICCVNKELYSYRTFNLGLSKNYSNLKHYLGDIEASNKKKEIAVLLKMGPEWMEYYDFDILYRRLLSSIVAVNSRNKDVYLQQRNYLKTSDFFRTYRKYIKKKFSSVKLFVLRNLFLRNYFFASIISAVVFK